MENNAHIAKAQQKLEWIAKLSKADSPPDEAGLRTLLNRIVFDVRAACRALEQSAVLGESDKSDLSDRSDGKKEQAKPGLIPTHGGYRSLKGFQVSEIAYDGTVIFCDRFISKRSRTHDQMVQAARSGRQNIAEGSMASATSKKTELKLTNVAKASLEELLLDFEDYLRQHKLRQWDKNDPEALAVRKRHRSFPREWFAGLDLSDRSDKSNSSDKRDRLDPYGIAKATSEVAANTLLCLINQATYLLKRQIQKLEQEFVEEGGFTERLYRTRTQRRRQQ